MLSDLGRNIRSLLWALVLGLSVWIAAVTAADPDEVRVLPAPVSVEVVGQDPSLVITGDVPTEVRLTLRAPQSVWNQLAASPDSVRAVLDLSAVKAGEHRLSPQVQIDARPVRIVTVNPSSILLSLEPLVSRAFELQTTLSGQPAVGYQAGNLRLEPQEVVVSGPQSRVSVVTRVGVVVNVGGIRDSIDRDFEVEVLDQNNAAVGGITVTPGTVHVSLPVIRQGGFRDMAVKVVVRGQVVAGYRLDSISVFPPVVTVYSSDAALVSALPGVVETQPLDLDAASSNLSLRVSLILPPGVSVVGQQTVLIQAGISPVQSSFTLTGQTVEITGLPNDLVPQISPATVDVILSGPIPILDTLRPQDVQVTVDVTNLAAGSYQLTPTVQILASNVDVETVNPGAVEVVLTPKANPTPRP
ncbi:MAG: CdaR family protein [Chloroflexota bacterium]